MSQLTLAQVFDAVQTWPVEQRQQLKQWLAQRETIAPPQRHTTETDNSLPPLDVIPPIKMKRVPPLFPDKDMSGEKQWIAENSARYAGQWVALEGNHLIKAGSSAKEVHDAALELGFTLPLLLLVESPDAPLFAGF
jgi:Family of unknown function (DUF5678)